MKFTCQICLRLVFKVFLISYSQLERFFIPQVGKRDPSKVIQTNLSLILPPENTGEDEHKSMSTRICHP